MSRFRALVCFVAMLSMVAAACGDAGTEDAVEQTPDAAEQQQEADESAPLGGDEDTPITVGGVLGLDDDCEALANVFLGFATIFSGGEMPAVNMESLSDLPGDLQDDAAVVLGAIEDFADGMAELGVDLSDPQSLGALTPAQQQQFAQLGELFDTDEVSTAFDNLDVFATEECEPFSP